MQSYKISTPEVFRLNVVKKLSEHLEKSSDGIIEQSVVGNIKKGIYNHCIREATSRNIIKKWENPIFVQLYVDRLRSVYMNLKNDELVTRIMTKDLLPQDLAGMTHQQYNPLRWQTLIKQKQKKDASKFNTNVQASTDVYMCKRCKSRRCIYSEQQIRSADESMTIFVTCLDCGKQWKC